MLNEKPKSKKSSIGKTSWVLIGLIVSGIALLIVFSLGGDNAPEPVIAISPTTQGDDPGSNNQSGGASQPAQNGSNDDLIERFLPSGGTASACSEDVGVIVSQGFAAELTINGRTLADNELNVNLDADGAITNEITATRSRGQYSFAPSDDCPDTGLIRATNNLLEVCVFRLGDSNRRCLAMESFTFNAA